MNEESRHRGGRAATANRRSDRRSGLTQKSQKFPRKLSGGMQSGADSNDDIATKQPAEPMMMTQPSEPLEALTQVLQG